MDTFIPGGLGWQRCLPDARDYSVDHATVRELSMPLRPAKRARKRKQVDLRAYFPRVDDQGNRQSSTAHALIGLVEYFDRRAHGHHKPLSPRFLYKMGRLISRQSADNGVDFRSCLKAIVQFGLPPNQYWPWDEADFDADPSSMLFSFAEPYRSLCYIRMDRTFGPDGDTLPKIKSSLNAGFPVAFGFSVPGSLSRNPDIPYRPYYDTVQGGQAAIAVGYNDDWMRATRGALLVRNSWGPSWGDKGYGWLPYAYVEDGLAADFWTLMHPDWIASGEFRRPRW